MIEEDDDDGEGRNSRISRRLDAGEYLVEVTAYRSTGRGGYALKTNRGVLREDRPSTLLLPIWLREELDDYLSDLDRDPTITENEKLDLLWDELVDITGDVDVPSFDVIDENALALLIAARYFFPFAPGRIIGPEICFQRDGQRVSGSDKVNRFFAHAFLTYAINEYSERLAIEVSSRAGIRWEYLEEFAGQASDPADLQANAAGATFATLLRQNGDAEPSTAFGNCECDSDCGSLTPVSGCEGECEYWWYGSEYERNCPSGWNGTDDGCDCGCQFIDPDCCR